MIAQDALNGWLLANLPIREVFIEPPYDETLLPAVALRYDRTECSPPGMGRAIECYELAIVPCAVGSAGNEIGAERSAIEAALVIAATTAARANAAWVHIETERTSERADQGVSLWQVKLYVV
jgi:hypothetical protein